MPAYVVFLALSLRVLAAEVPTEKELAAELELLQGTWKIESVEVDGRQLDVAAFKDITRVVEGHDITWKNKDQVIARTRITFDPTRQPKTMDSTFTEGDNADKTMLGIYEIDGDEFRICSAPFDRLRPTEFASPPGSGVLIFKAKRVAP
ncbi:MAG: TIGR03067 domain-containing protein [Pirellulales bacterium]|nr:TIGR03067 domain-containing protein [Pirellulales bacterium]